MMGKNGLITRRTFFGGAAFAALQLLAPASAMAEEENGVWDTNGEVPVWIDSIGRKVEVSKEIKRITPAGVYAESVIASIDPGLLASSAGGNKELSWLGIGKGLPVTGGLYSASAPIDVDSIKEVAPDLIIDVGELKPTTEVDLDMLQEETGIPVVFVHSDFVHLCRAYEELSRLLDSDKAADLSEYALDVANYIRAGASCIDDSERYSLYVGEGPDGSTLRTDGSLLGEVVKEVGCGFPTIGGGTRTRKVDNGDLLSWDPDVIVLADKGCYADYADSNPCTAIAWDCLSAGVFGCVRGSAVAGNLWFGDLSPLGRQLIGSLYLGNLLYPDVYQYKFGDVVGEYYSLFFEGCPAESAISDTTGVNDPLPLSANAIKERKENRRQELQDAVAAEIAYEKQWQKEQEEKAQEILEQARRSANKR